ncbi:hypothetical protein LMG28727_06289 [Paraburkholderia kirstenboschensis]|nr:hypothetical protein LMG28727_06289 [Paraburkholderia kirstenboschensis]
MRSSRSRRPDGIAGPSGKRATVQKVTFDGSATVGDVGCIKDSSVAPL